MQLLWSPVGGSLLIHTHVDVDTTGNSYYGETKLFAMASDGKTQNVQLPKAGPIHDVKWSPLGGEFVCLFGTSPPQAALFDSNCKLLHDFKEAPHNSTPHPHAAPAPRTRATHPRAAPCRPGRHAT